MYLVVTAYGADYVALGGDRGSWDLSVDGTPHNPTPHPGSKLHVVPGCPMVVASVGPSGASGVIEKFIARKAYTLETYRMYDAAQELWAELFAIWEPLAKAKFEAAGLSTEVLSNPELLDPATKDFYTKQERLLGGMTLLVTGVDTTGITRQYHGEYPKREIEMDNLMISADYTGLTSGCTAMGSHDVLDGFRGLDIDFSRLSHTDAVDLCRLLLDTVDRTEEMRERSGKTRTVLGPYDLCLVTKNGVEWICGSEERVQETDPLSSPLRSIAVAI